MAASMMMNAHSPIPAKNEEPWNENCDPKYQIPRNTKSTAAMPAMVISTLNPAIETHQNIICIPFYKSFSAKSQSRLTTFAGSLKRMSCNLCRKHSFGSGAISNSCRHEELTGNGFDLKAHLQDRFMLQGWEKDFSKKMEVLN